MFSPELTSSPSAPGDTFFSVVVPCFNEEECLPALLKVLVPVLQEPTHGKWEIILVDDGSSDQTARAIALAHQQESRIRGIVLSRNFGHQAALFAGLAYASGQYIGIMDADLQDPPAILMDCLQKAKTEGYDLVYAIRKRRQASLPLKFSYWLFYRIMGALAEYKWTLDAGDFSVFHRKVLHLIMDLPEHVRVLRGLRSWVGLRQGFLEYARPGRAKGESKYSVFKLTGLALNALISFSNLPLRLASLVGVGMSVLSVVLGVLLLANRFFHNFTLFGYYIGANPGTTTIVILLLLIGSLLFLCLGILGEYLGVVIKEVKRRPIAVVDRLFGIRRTMAKSHLILETETLNE